MSEEELNQMSNNELIGIIKSQRFEIKKLESIRKETLEYINRKKYQPSPLGFELELNPKELYKLQKILNKGSDKE